MDGAPARADMELGGAPEGLDALIVADRIKAQGGTALPEMTTWWRGSAAPGKDLGKYMFREYKDLGGAVPA